MENQETKIVPQDDMWRKIEKSHRRGKVMGGLLIIAIGSLFLAKELGAQIPAWIFSWKTLLIAAGLVTAVKHKFMHPGWIVMVGIGGAFLVNDLYPDLHIRPFLWPVLIILLGLFILFKPRRKEMRHARKYWKAWHEQHHHHDWSKRRHHRRNWHMERCGDPVSAEEETRSEEDYLDSVSVMGGVKKNILSKKFKGGDVVNIFGGAHINLSQADFEGTARLEITQIFGGTKLVIPANWEINTESSVAICGSVEDKRPVQANLGGEPRHVLVLVGTTVFGGIEITSFS